MAYILTTATKKLIQLKKRIKGIAGGSSAGKTISIIQILIDKAQRDKKSTLTSITSESMPHLKRGAIRDFLNIMEEHHYFNPDLWNKTDFTYTFETGSKIEFFSLDMPHKVRGPRRQRLFINEANNIPKETFDQLEIRTTEEIWLDWNPTQEFWFYTDLKDKRPDVDFEILTYKDNEGLDESIVKSIEMRKNNKNWWLVYGLGQLGEVEGKIYKDWAIIDEIPHEARLERYGLDFGYSCFVGNTLIKCINGDKKISNIKVGDLVLTRLGYKPVKNIFNNGRRNVIEREITLSDNCKYKIIGTPDHNFNVNNKWKTLDKIQKKNNLYVLKEKNITDTKMGNTQTISITQPEMESIFYTEKFIKNIKVIFQEVMSFITLMVILLITKLQIWLVSLIQNTLKFINNWINGIILKKVINFVKQYPSTKLIGTIEEKKFWKTYKMILENVSGVLKNTLQLIHTRDFVQNLVTIVGNIKQKKTKQLSYAKTAVKGLWGISILNQNRVQSSVPINYQSVIEVKTNKEYIDTVYNIEVEGIHEYFANGMLVYNCDPTAIVAIYKYNEGFIVDEVAFQKGLMNNQISDILKNQVNAVCIADSAEPKSIDEILSYGGLTILPSIKGPGSVNKGIDWVQQQRISVTQRSLNIIKEYRNYMWKTDKDGKIINEPDVGWDHSMDAIRYAINDLRPKDSALPVYDVKKWKW